MTSARRGGGGAAARHMPGDEIGYFARSFADQPDNDRIGLRAIDNHVHQHRLSHARTGHDADPLADPERGHVFDPRGEAVDRVVELQVEAEVAGEPEIEAYTAGEPEDGGSFAAREELERRT